MYTKELKKKRWKIIAFFLMLLLGGIKSAAASPYQDISEIPLFVQLFLGINIFQLVVATVMIYEVKKISFSTVWNNIYIANLFNLLHTLALAIILTKLYPSTDITVLVLIAVLYTFAVFMVNTTEYLLVNPILKGKINFSKTTYILFYIVSIAILWFFFVKFILFVDLPIFSYLPFLLFFLFFYGFVIISFCYIAFSISKGYEKIGFVQKPFFTAGTGMIAIVSALISITYLTKDALSIYFYYLVFYFIVSAFTSTYYLKFIIEYPSLLQPKWKTFLPFDLPKATATITLAFLAASLYFTVNESPNSIIYQNISYIFVFAFLLPLLLAVILIFTYLKTISTRIKLRYWVYLKYAVYIHLTVTFYVFGLIFLSWNNATSITKMLCAMFGLATFACYLFFALDLRKIIEDRNIKPTFDGLDILRYTVSLSSWFFLIFFGISFTYGKPFAVFGFEFVSYPVILFLICFSLIALGIYLRVTYIVFEKIRGNRIWGTLTYIATFISFLLLYLIYSSLSTYMQRFPFRDLSFVGYFIVMLCAIASILTLRREPKYKGIEEEEITSLLNSRARHFLRTDYLEGLWETAVDSYVGEEETGISFDPSGRRFNLENADAPTRQKIAVWILLEMYNLPDMEKVGSKTIEETKEEIAAILKEKVLLLPENLRSQFDVDVYYPILFEKVVNTLIGHLETFVSFAERENIFSQLKRRDEKYTGIEFERGEIRVKGGTRFSRDEFFALFKHYLESLEDKFPFKACLLYELIREELKKELGPYDITVGNLLDIVPTGLEEMDKVMRGGLAKGSSTLLIAEETKTKHKILLSFIKQGLRARNSVIYATAKRPAQQIQGELLIDFDELQNFMLLDLYENIFTEKRVYKMVEEEHRIIVPLNKILFQRSIVKTIKSYPKDLPKIVVIDVYDNFSRYYSPEEVQKILQDQIDGLKRWNCTSLITINPHSYLMRKEDVEVVKKNFDNVMILSGEDKDASVFIEKLYHGTPSKPVVRLQ